MFPSCYGYRRPKRLVLHYLTYNHQLVCLVALSPELIGENFKLYSVPQACLFMVKHSFLKYLKYLPLTLFISTTVFVANGPKLDIKSFETLK